MQHELIVLLIVEDEHALAQLHAELIGKHPGLRLVGVRHPWPTRRRKLK